VKQFNNTVPLHMGREDVILLLLKEYPLIVQTPHFIAGFDCVIMTEWLRYKLGVKA
jgi:hypothetical protein